MAKPSIVFLVNGDASSAMAMRARAFAARLADEFDIDIAYRSGNKIRAIGRFFRRLSQRRPSLCYVFDMAFSGVAAAAFYRLVSRCRVIVDTGDAIYQLSRSTGNRSTLGLALTRLLEWTGFAISDRVIVRSHPHQELLQLKGISADVIPDGVDTEEFRPLADPQLSRELQLEGCTVVGLLGSLVWSPRWQMCYGWELIEVIHRLKDQRVKGLIIGDGTGAAWLKARSEALGITDRMVFLGRVPYQDLPRFIGLMDICLSTQTNDVPGQVRTTGKLPIYLSCGRFVLSTQVGEAARVLPAEMLVPYEGTKDAEYPQRLANRIQALLEQPHALHHAEVSIRIAKEHFDYRVLASKLRQVIENVLSKPGWRGRTAPTPQTSLAARPQITHTANQSEE